MTSTLSDLLGQADVPLASIDPEDQVLAGMCAIRHAKSEADAEVLHEMLGIGSPEDELTVIAMIGALR